MTNTTRLRVEPLEDRATPSAAGELDPTFSGDGVVTSALDPFNQVSLAADGRILTLDRDGSVSRFESDGDLDTTFGASGTATVPGFNIDFGAALAAAPDGGAVVAWVDPSMSAGAPPTFQLVRLTAAGTVDPTFGTGGTAVVTVRSDAAGVSMPTIVVMPDGRVVLAGNEGQNLPTPPPAQSASQVVVARLTPAGQLDTTFGAGGTTIIDLPASSISGTRATSLDVQPDGRVVVLADAAANQFNGTPGGPILIRLNTAGLLDPTFGSGGVASVSSGTNSYAAVRVLADGRLMLLGGAILDPQSTTVSYVGVVARLTPDGRFDATYDGDGIVRTQVLASERAGSHTAAAIRATVDPSGRVVFGVGSSLYRFTATGAADPAFAATVSAGFFGTPGLTAQPNGDIVLFGAGGPQPAPVGQLARLVGVATPAGFTPATTSTFVAGGPTNGTVQVLTYTGPNFTVAGPSAFVAGLGQNLRPALADVTGDGTPDYVLAAGPGGPPRVVVLDGTTGRVAADFAPFESSFAGGAFVAAADLDRDGRAEVIVTPDQGGGGRVVVYSVATGGAVTLRASFFGIDDPNFRGGARVAAGDVDRNGVPDVIVAAGFGGGPRVAIFGGTSVVTGAAARLTNDFFAFPGADAERLRNGAYVAAGDRDGDGFADLVFGGGPGGAPRVFILSGALVSAGQVGAAQAAPLANFFSYPVPGDESDRSGARVAARDVDGDGLADLALGIGAGPSAVVRFYTTTDPNPSVLFPNQSGVFGGSFLPDGVLVG